MNTLLLRRNYKYILSFVCFLWIFFVFGSTRIISYNFGEYVTSIEYSQENIENSIDVFQEDILHEIIIDITPQEYADLVLYYQQNNEKEYLETSVIIDGVEIQNIGLKLKWNKLISNDEIGLESVSGKFSFLIKFDKYVDGQTYLWKTEIALISGWQEALEGEYIAGKIYEQYDITSPKSSFTQLFAGDIQDTYLLKEVVNEEFIQENFGTTNAVVYKAENALSFTYLGEDPASYSDLFTQKTLVNNYDLKKLIEVLEFASLSSDENFEFKFQKYIDIESYTKFLAIRDLLYAEDDKIHLLNSYYISFDIASETIQFIPWEETYLVGIEETSTYKILEKIFSKQELVDLSKRDMREILDNFSNHDADTLKNKYTNDLEDRFLDEDGFSSLYTETKQFIYNDMLDAGYISILEEQLFILFN